MNDDKVFKEAVAHVSVAAGNMQTGSIVVPRPYAHALLQVISDLQEENGRLTARLNAEGHAHEAAIEHGDDWMHEADTLKDRSETAEAALSQSRLEVERLRDGLEDAHCALVAVVAAMKRAPSMQGREYVGLGIQVNSAINKAFAALSDKASVPDDKQGEA